MILYQDLRHLALKHFYSPISLIKPINPAPPFSETVNDGYAVILNSESESDLIAGGCLACDTITSS